MTSSLSGLLALAALLLAPAASADLEEAAFAQDDACEAGNITQCALHAIQRRIGRVGAGSEEVARVRGHPTVKLEAYRAVWKEDLVHDFSNVDMATVSGVMNYLHTDVVPEHVGDYAGYEPKIGTDHRLNKIDTIVGVDMHVKNPESVIDAVGNFVDFALSAHFISGEATGPAYNWNFGDIVGAQKGEDARWPYADPYYRFSLSGFCPNLKWNVKEKGAIKAEQIVKERENGDNGEGLLEVESGEDGEDDDSGEGLLEVESGRRRRRRRNIGVCMTYSNQFHQPYGKVLTGGLCPNGTEPGKMPEGKSGCVYTYVPPKTEVNLDELVGITKEECGDRKCEDWRDFRRHCSNRNYHRKFNYKSRRRYNTILRTRACVEYDIHKACALDCNSKACLKVPSHRRELGLPFWKGRCSAHMNAMRAERLAVALGITEAEKTHQLLQAPTGETCLSASSTLCEPNATAGGPYCTRLWGGVCQPCYVPGAEGEFEHGEETPMCPWSIFKMTGDYSAAKQPRCSSNLPKDLCCLYTSSCNSTFTNRNATIDYPMTQDVFNYVSSLQDRVEMMEYLATVLNETTGILVNDEGFSKLEKIGYWQFGLSPIPGQTLEKVIALLKHYFV